MSPTHQDLSNDTTFSQSKSRVPVPLIPLIFKSSLYLSLIQLKFKSSLYLSLIPLNIPNMPMSDLLITIYCLPHTDKLFLQPQGLEGMLNCIADFLQREAALDLESDSSV